jgi:hypothetical protein
VKDDEHMIVLDFQASGMPSHDGVDVLHGLYGVPLYFEEGQKRI